jgi:hypothetical protein
VTTPLLHLTKGLRDVAADIQSELQDCRTSLPAAANNKSPYPIAPFARYAHTEIVSGRGPVLKGLEHLMAITFDNLDQQMPASEAKRWLYRAERYVDVHAAERYRDRTVRPISSAFRHEQRANCAFDLDELRVVENRRSPEALRSAIRSCRAQIKASEDALQSLEHEYASVVTSESTVFDGSLVGA